MVPGIQVVLCFDFVFYGVGEVVEEVVAGDFFDAVD